MWWNDRFDSKTNTIKPIREVEENERKFLTGATWCGFSSIIINSFRQTYSKTTKFRVSQWFTQHKMIELQFSFFEHSHKNHVRFFKPFYGIFYYFSICWFSLQVMLKFRIFHSIDSVFSRDDDDEWCTFIHFKDTHIHIYTHTLVNHLIRTQWWITYGELFEFYYSIWNEFHSLYKHRYIRVKYQLNWKHHT